MKNKKTDQNLILFYLVKQWNFSGSLLLDRRDNEPLGIF
jgi:predicted RNA binding protein with dsRBD fold (UPF0201 family)